MTATVAATARVEVLTWADVEAECRALAARWSGRDVRAVWGVPTGGSVVAARLAGLTGWELAESPEGSGVLVVDDLIDSGRTMAPYAGTSHDALFRKSHSPENLAPDASLADGWLAFPWEHTHGPEDAVIRLLEFAGENPYREGLRETPRRVLSALAEATEGYATDVGALLSVQFDEQHDQLVVLSGVEFSSTCEHHLAPFRGVASLGYIPTRNVVGLSKLARLVDAFARRLQVQERMTSQIADALVDHLDPLGVGVIVTAHHSCMGNRGVRKHQAEMTTSVMRGALLHDSRARAEFMQLVGTR